MKLRGFGKNYFRLVAIQAYSAGAVLRRRHTALISRSLSLQLFGCDDAKEDPPDISELCECSTLPIRQENKPCHCDRFFRRLAWLLLHLSERFKRPACRCRYTKTGLAPPITR